MEKIFIKIILISIAVFGTGFLFVDYTLAQPPPDNLIVQFEQTPLFYETNFLPGESVARWVKVTNNSGETQRIATEAINYPNPIPTNDLSRVVMIVIKEGATDLYGGSSPTGSKSLFNFYQDSEIYPEISLSDLANGITTQYDFVINFPSEKQNEWQGATTTFDILIGFQGASSPYPPSPPSPPPSGPVLPSGLTIQYEKDSYISTTTTIIEWFTSYNATSRVIYDTQPGVFDLNILPNYGYAFSKEDDDIFGSGKGVSHRVTLTGLLPGTTYYYRTVSHASLAISQEHSFTTLGTKIEEEIPEETLEEQQPSEEIGIPEIIMGIPEKIVEGVKKITKEILPPAPEEVSLPEKILPSEEKLEKAPGAEEGLASIFTANTIMFWGEISKSTLSIMGLILGLIGLVFVGFREWEMRKEKKQRSNV